MTEEQANTIIELLEEISKKLGNGNFYGRSLDDLHDKLDSIDDNVSSISRKID